MSCVAAQSVMFDSLQPFGLEPTKLPFMGFLRQEYCSGLPFPPPGDISNPGIEPRSPALQADSLLLSHWGSPVEYLSHGELRGLFYRICPCAG